MRKRMSHGHFRRGAAVLCLSLSLCLLLGSCSFSLEDAMQRLKAYVNGEEIPTPPEGFVEARENDLYTYDVYETYVVITGYKGEDVDVTVPWKLDELPVRKIGELAFYYGVPVESVSLPNTVTELEENAFYYCRSLKKITLPGSITSIGDKCFSWCSSLTTVTLPRSVTVIPEYCFNECTALKTVVLPEGITSVGTRAFSGCKSLTAMSFGESLASIGSFAFRGCTSLDLVHLPGSCETVGTDPFGGCGENLMVGTGKFSPCWEALAAQGMRPTEGGNYLRLPTQAELDAEANGDTSDPFDTSDDTDPGEASGEAGPDAE